MHPDDLYILLFEKKAIPGIIFYLNGKLCLYNSIHELIEKTKNLTTDITANGSLLSKERHSA